MASNEVLDMLRANLRQLQQRFGVESLAVFGAASRGDLSVDSDVDLLVRFNRPASFDSYFALKFHLEDLLGRSVDLATDKMVGPRLRRHIEKDLLVVA